MQIYGYPGERVDFVSRSAAAGSIMLRFTGDKVREIAIYPQRSQRERIDVFVGKTRLSGLDEESLAEVIAQAGDGLSATAAAEGLGEVIFRL